MKERKSRQKEKSERRGGRKGDTGKECRVMGVKVKGKDVGKG